MKEIKEILQERFNCSDRLAKLTENYLEIIEPDLQNYLNCWLENENNTYFEVRSERNGKEEIHEFEVEGYTITSLMRDYCMQFPGALLTLDGLLKQPEITKRALEEGIC